ncbi:MAG: DUF126 domain-containing protein [Thermoplasmatales archaeon]
MIKGRGLSPGVATSSAVVCDQFISPLGEISREGLITSGKCENANIIGKILAFKGGRGSTVGSYTFLELKSKKMAPAGLINEFADQMVVTGAIISEIPMVDRIPLDILLNGDMISINGTTGEVSIDGVEEKRVATVYLVHKGRLLILKRSDKAASFPGQYGGISGYMEKGETPEETGRREMMEECGINNSVLKKIGNDVYVRSNKILYAITPMLMESGTDKVTLNLENSAYEWVTDEQLQEHETVTKFKETFRALMTKPGK